MTQQALPRNGKIRFGGFFLFKRYGREIGFEEKCLSLSYQKRVKRIVLFINYKDMHRWRDAWRKSKGNEPTLWGHETNK